MKFTKYKNLLKDSFFDNINGYSLDLSQRRIIVDDSNNLLVVAGAGSGKTLTIIGKIKYLIEKQNIKEKDILCISFTNETVNNLKEKIGYKVDCYTFHKLSLRILKEFNYNYKIVKDDLLEYLINEYFETKIYYNGYIDYVIEYFKILLEKEINYEEITRLFYKEFCLYKKMILSFINKIRCNNHNYYDFRDYLIKNKRYNTKVQYKNNCFLFITFDIYREYLIEINSYNGIDFADMINKSIIVIKRDGMYHKYKHIIIDEFQDTSFIRYQLIKEIQNRTNAKLMCVGDDYQSIYGFSGCNLDLFINFKKYFNNSKILYIDRTYRNSYEIVNTSCQFIKKNHYQLRKKIKVNFFLKKSIKVLYYNNDYQDKFYKLLDYLIDNNKKNILVLGRNNRDISVLVDSISGDFFIYREVKIKYLTVHRSKGLEQDNVIVINMNDDYLGFPNKIIDDNVFDLIDIKKERYPYASERRLFYVALTRTKEKVFLLANKDHPSIFINEIINKIDELIL